jgi:hypothetical protein
LSFDGHAIDFFDGFVRRFHGFELDESVPAGFTRGTVDRDFAGQDVAKQRKGIEQSFVVDVLGQIFDKDVAGARLAHGGVPLGPHDAASLAHDWHVVHGVESTFGIVVGIEVDVCVAQRTTGDAVTTDTNGTDGSDGIKNFEKFSFGAVGDEVAYVKRGGLLGVPGGTWASTGRCGHCW